MTIERVAAAKAAPRAALALVGTAMAPRAEILEADPVLRDAVSKVRAQKGDVLIVAAQKADRIDPLLVKP